MTVKKLQRYIELETFDNVFERRVEMKGRWNAEFFRNSNPITLELACGKGEYSLALAQKFPQRNFIGIDLKGSRLWRGARTALEQNLTNVGFLRAQIEQLADFFAPGEVSQIWIPFPDPFLRPGKAKKRLTSPRFLNLYRKVLKPGSLVYLKTDDDTLFSYSFETLREQGCAIHSFSEDLYASPNGNELLKIPTYYEQRHLLAKKKIKCLCFSVG